jgi:hypothetical protein
VSAWAAAVVLLVASAPAFASGALADAVAVTSAGRALVVGAANPAAETPLDCAADTVQHTVRRCRLKEAAAASASCLGRTLDGATFNIHFQGEIVNMSATFPSGTSPDDVLSQLRAVLGGRPKLEYWADDAHLYASYIWVDGETEVELTQTVKGDPGDGKARLYVSSLRGDRPLNPIDAPGGK